MTLKKVKKMRKISAHFWSEKWALPTFVFDQEF